MTGPSLRLRLLVGMTLVAVVFLSAAGLVLDRAFQASARRAAAEQLDVRLLSLVGSTELTRNGVEVPLSTMDTRWSQPASGIYGIILDRSEHVLWRSASLAGANIAPLLAFRAQPGERRHSDSVASPLGELLVSGTRLFFERADGKDVELVFVAALGPQARLSEVESFRATLWVGLGAVALVLIAAELLLFRQFTQPLVRLAQAVGAIERGERAELGAGWPQEVTRLTQTLDRFIGHERQLRERYVNLTDDLAHSLKTPLAVLKNEANSNGGSPADEEARLQIVREQVERMEKVLAARLERVRVRPVIVSGGVKLRAEAEKVASALRRLFNEVRFTVEVEESLVFPGDARDIVEVLGNLMENAAKYGRHVVRLRAESAADHLHFWVEDDGEGIPEEVREQVVRRGVRADTRAEGQGIGLAQVADIVAGSYFGRLEIGASAEFGGARIDVWVPSA